MPELETGELKHNQLDDQTPIIHVNLPAGIREESQPNRSCKASGDCFENFVFPVIIFCKF